MYPSIQIPKAEFQTRSQKLMAHLETEGLPGAVLFDSYYVHYYSGFAFIPTERPVAYAVNAAGD